MKNGFHKGIPVICTVNGWGCPYFNNKTGQCMVDDAVADCDDFATFFPTWEDWEET